MTSAQLDDFFTFLRFPSISTDPAHRDDVRACAGWLVKRLRGMGLDAELRDTPGHPIVLAKNAPIPGAPTVLIYGHYDVQPVDPLQLWDHPPFEPHLEDNVVFARGATDNKGQILAHILGIEACLKREGNLPINLVLLIEGEEEIGSKNLGPFVQKHLDELRCDVAVISDTGMIARQTPTFTYGLRGVAALELEVTGPSADLHSGVFGGAVMNPLAALSRLMSSLHDETGRVAVAGFYDEVAELQQWERDNWSQLPLNDARIRELTGVPELKGEEGFSAVERTWARPTAELNGFYGGYQGPGSKTVIPSKAHAKLTFRLVPNQAPEKLLELTEAHLRKHCPAGVKLEIRRGHAGGPYLVDPHTGYGLAAQRALRETFSGREPALIREGGSVPIVAEFRNLLGVDTLLLGLALPDARVHSPNERFPLENLDYGIALNQALLRSLRDAGGIEAVPTTSGGVGRA